MTSEWISIAESKPDYNRGLLLKIIPKPEKYRSINDPSYEIKDVIFYGFFWPCEYVYITAEIHTDGRMNSTGWKATKEYYLDEIYWFTHIGYGS